MPPLKHPAKLVSIPLAPKKAVLAARTEVLGVGGGPAGMGAAMGAAQTGAKVILVERYGFLGGNATAALVMPLMSFHTHGRASKPPLSTPALLPQDHGKGEPVIGGVLAHFLGKLIQSGGAVKPSLETGYVVPFDPEIFKLTALEMLDEAGVEFLFHSFACDILFNKKIRGVVFQTKSGLILIESDMIVDCTGDGDIAALAGAPYEMGREQDGLVQPMTLMFRMVEFERNAFQNYVREHPEDWRDVHGLWSLIRKASERGELNLPREDILFFATPHEREVSVNSTRITRVLGTDVWDLSYAEWESRRQMKQISSFLRKYVPGFEKAYIAQSGVQIGVRETRRILGDYQLTADDILNARKFPDAIARSAYPVDIHNPKGRGTVLKNLPPNEAYDIPLRALLPQKTQNLLVAGRCISGTHEALSSYRVMPTAMATGHAAGVCAALAVKMHCPARKVPVSRVQELLVAQGANLSHSINAT